MDENLNQQTVRHLPAQMTVDLNQLRKNLHGKFNLDELKSLCFTMGLVYEDVEGGTREAKVDSLVDLVVRKNQLGKLIQTCEDLRREEQWIDSVKLLDAKPPVIHTTGSSPKSQTARIEQAEKPEPSKWQKYSFTILGLVVASILFFFIDQKIGFNLDGFFQPVIAYDFNDGEIPTGMRKAQTEYTSDLKIQTPLMFDGFLMMDLTVPALVRGESVAEYGGGVCIPVDPETRYDAISAKVKVEDAKTFFATFWATNGEEWFLSGETILPSDRWTRLFWGTEFGHSRGDGQWSEWPIQGVKSNSPGVTEFCLWLYSEQAYQTSAFVDELTIYQRTQPLGN